MDQYLKNTYETPRKLADETITYFLNAKWIEQDANMKWIPGQKWEEVLQKLNARSGTSITTIRRTKGDMSEYESTTRNQARKYPVGKRVTVFYNPKRLALSVLVPRPTIFSLFLIILISIPAIFFYIITLSLKPIN